MKFRVLGPLEVAEGREPLALGGAKQRSVLALLLLNANQVVSTDRLIHEIWGDGAREGAGRTLQVYVSNLRKLLDDPALVVSQRPGYLIRIVTDQLDALRFEQLAAEGSRLLAAGDAGLAAAKLTDALALWRGPLLADLADEPFVQPAAQRLGELRLVAVEERIEADLILGKHASLVAELEAIVAEQPLRERLWGQLMVALYRAGRQADSLRAYARVRETLIDQLGIDPGPELRALERGILAHDPALSGPARQRATTATPGLPAGPAVPAPPAIEWAASLTFVGRRRELDRLAQLWHAADHGPPQLVVIVGEPGIGKTCLAAQAAQEARAEGATVLFGRCEEEALRPYQPFAEAFEHYVRCCLLESDEPQLERIASEFAPLLPEIRDRLTEEPVADAGEWERPRLFENVASFLARLSGVAPVMVVVDDLQWADASTLLLLRHLLRRPHPAAVLIVATLRPTEASGRAVLNELTDLRRHRAVQRLHLGGLEEDQVRELLDAVAVPLSNVHQRAWARDLRAWTEGNPLFIEELVRHLHESGLMDHARTPRLEDLVLPDDISEVIGRRLSRLSPAATHSLLVAAVLGRNFRVDVVEAVAELGENELLGALEEAAAAGIIVEDPDAVGLYGFSHALVRDALYRRLSTLRRARLHRRIGEALEVLHEGDREAHVAELAYHFCRASPSDARVPDYATRAGDQAMAQLAFEEAAELYLAAVGAECRLASVAADDLPSLLSLQIRAVLALARSGATDRAQEQLEKFGLASRDLEDVPPGVAEDIAALRARLTKDRALASDGPEREALARNSAELYEAIFVRLKRPYACVNAATMWLLAGDDMRAAGLAASALQLARQATPESPADAYWLAATEAEAALLLGDSSGAAEALRRAVAQPAADLAARMVTRKQLEIVCATKDVDTDVLSPLGVPGATAAPA